MTANEHAFPHLHFENGFINLKGGLTKRELIASLVFHAMSSSPDLLEVVSKRGLIDGSYAEMAAKQACQWADALLAELAKGKP